MSAKKPRKDAPKPRRARGTGSLFKRVRRGKEVWVARIPTGRQTKSGHTQYQEISDTSQSDLIARLKKLQPPGTDTTVAEWSERWLAACRVRPSTLDTYRYTARNFIIPTLGHIRVCALTHTHIDGAVRQWLSQLGPNSVRTYLTHLRACLSEARRAGLLTHNPASEVKTPKVPRRVIEPIPPADLSRLIAAAMMKPGTWVLALLAATGCRIGEALALDVTDYDPRTGLLTINKTWTRQHGTRPPKSENGIRTIRVPESARPALVRAIGGRREGPLFQRYHGQRYRPQSVREAFDRLQAQLGLARVNLHGLRHAAVSNLVANGAELADVAVYCGDAIQTIISRYLHPTRKDPSLVMDRLLAPERKRRG